MIRYATKDDISELSRIHNESIRNTYQGIYSRKYFEELSDLDREKELAQKIILEPCRIIVDISEEQTIRGFVLFWLQDVNKRRGYLNNIHVRKEYKRQGIGLELIKKSAEIMLQNGIEEMFLFCVEKNINARKFYDHIGFKFCGYEWEEEDDGENLIPCCKLKINNNILFPGVIKKNEESMFLDVIKGDFCLYGAGTYGQMFFGLFGDRFIPKLIFDTNPKKVGQSIDGIPIVMPCDIDMPIVVASMYYSEIRDYLIGLGATEILPFHPWIYRNKEKR